MPLVPQSLPDNAIRRISRRTFVLGAAGVAASIATVRPGRADTAARVVAQQWVGPRTLDLTLSSPALAVDGAMVRLLVPPDWAPDAGRTWPVLYLLHGAGDDYTSWTRSTDVAALTEQTDVLVVMPTGGRAGFYSDWWNHGAGGPPRWETLHLVELRQILETGYAASTVRAIAGLSMGGFGAMSYAARHPGMFRAAAAYSGIVHTTYQSPRSQLLIRAALSSEGHDPQRLWGDPVLNADIWSAHNPYDLAPRLVGIPLYVSSGNGQPGPLDPPLSPPDPVVEAWCGEMAAAFVQRLRGLGANVVADLYGPGLHNWPYWQRELHDSFPMLMRAIGVSTSTTEGVHVDFH